MSQVVQRLADEHDEIPTAEWRAFWDRLQNDGVQREEAVELLTALTNRLPDHGTLRNMLVSLGDLHPPVQNSWPGTVNIVGTGGGPRTFNVSTAAAFVAAATGALVVKTGSRAYTGNVGSLDMLERLGVPRTKSHTETEDSLDRFGIAFAGQYVYPGELTRLARIVFPTGMREFSPFLNAIGPFIAQLPVTAQITGMSAAVPGGRLRALASQVEDRSVWLCSNDHGVDELLGFADNTVHTGDGDVFLPRGHLTSGGGTLASIAPAGPATDATVEHFLNVISGNAGIVATETVCLNAAAMAVAAGRFDDWAPAFATAMHAVRTGVARDLVDLMRDQQSYDGTSPKPGSRRSARHG